MTQSPLHATPFFYITCKGVCVNLLLLQVSEHSFPLQSAIWFPGHALCFDWNVSPIWVGLNSSTSSMMEWSSLSAFLKKELPGLDQIISSSATSCLCCFWGDFVPHYPSCTVNCNPFFCAASSISVQAPRPPRPPRPPRHSCGNHCFTNTRALKQWKIWKGLLSVWLLCCRCFCFYCRGIHDGLMNRGPVSDGLQCPRCSRLHIIIGLSSE